VERDISAGSAASCIERIHTLLAEAGAQYGDAPLGVEELAPGKTKPAVHAMFAEAMEWAKKRIAVKDARYLINEMKLSGVSHYVPPREGTLRNYCIVPTFVDAGIPIEIFAHGARPTRESMEELVVQAEDAILREDQKRIHDDAKKWKAKLQHQTETGLPAHLR
jgi:hypothetical protein